MLCGRFPFWGKTDIEYMKSLTRGPAMVGDGWDEVSDLGKQFLKSLLQLDPKKRLNAAQALSHPWILGKANEGAMKKRLSSVMGLVKIQSQMADIQIKNGDAKSPPKTAGEEVTPRGVQGDNSPMDAS